MANYCVFCQRSRPPEPVRCIILGEQWIEFCAECADTPDVFESAETGEKLSPAELFALLEKERQNE